MDRSPLSSEKLAQAMRVCGRAWVQALGQQLEPHGLTLLQWAVLECVLDCPGTRQRQVAEMVGTDAPSLVRLLDGLEQAGWVTRKPLPEDRRVKLVWPQPSAQERVAAVRQALGPVYERAFAGMSDEDRKKLLALVRHTEAMLRAPVSA